MKQRSINNVDIGSGRRYHAALEEIFSKLGADTHASHFLREVRRSCSNASLAVEDDYCREQLALIERYAGDLFSKATHQNWQRGSVPGVDVLKHKIGKCLGTFEARLISLANA